MELTFIQKAQKFSKDKDIPLNDVFIAAKQYAKDYPGTSYKQALLNLELCDRHNPKKYSIYFPGMSYIDRRNASSKKKGL